MAAVQNPALEMIRVRVLLYVNLTGPVTASLLITSKVNLSLIIY